MTVLTAKQVYGGDKTTMINAEVPEGLYSDLLLGYELGLKSGKHNLTIEEFMGICILSGSSKILNMVGVKTD